MSLSRHARNVLGGPLAACCMDPVTGYFRDGFCHTNAEDHGVHTVCVVVSDAFLAFSKKVGNDLSTPRPEYGFPGLKDGDKWCLCAARWEEAFMAGMAPRVVLEATHERTLEVVTLEELQAFSAGAAAT
ncbi:MAG TPA: DUF2237 domain-containing protein [Usitatibacteraceae bacterium]|nr:DUF2237 domain-containing protein [Usitatibacteraceae bacterium]